VLFSPGSGSALRQRAVAIVVVVRLAAEVERDAGIAAAVGLTPAPGDRNPSATIPRLLHLAQQVYQPIRQSAQHFSF
jgi:hypothetical protein